MKALDISTFNPSPSGEDRSSEQIWRGSLWLWFQTGTDIGLAFVFTWVVLHRLGPDGFGTVALVQSTLNLAGLLTLNPEQALIRYLPDLVGRHKGDEARRMVVVVYLLKTTLAGLASAVLWWLAPWLGRFFPYPYFIPAIRIGCLSLFAVSIANAGTYACLGLLRLPVRAWMTILRRLVEVGVVLLASLHNLDPAKVVFGLAMGDVVAAIGFSIAIIVYLHQIPGDTGATTSFLNIGKRIFRYCLPLLGVNLTDIAGSNLTKLFVGVLASPTVFGYYSVARMASERLMTFMAQAPMLAVPVIAQKNHSQAEIQESHPLMEKVLELQWILAGAGVLVTWAVAPLLLQIIGGPDFQPSISALRIMSFAVMVNSANSSLHVFFLSHERTMGNFYQALVQLGFGLAIVGLLVPIFGSVGAALADIGRELSALFLGVWLVRKWFRFQFTSTIRLILFTLAVVLLLILPLMIWPSTGIAWLLLLWLPAALLLYAFLVLPGMLHLPARSIPPAIYHKIRSIR